MTTLSPDLRRQLEKTVVEARSAAEASARMALHTLAVHEQEPYEHMGEGSRELRRRLRAHARQLGDRRDPRSGKQAINRLVHECAYEQWHGMLFARFLAENDLLIEPDLDVPVTLDECEELAMTSGGDKWQLAARFAHEMLPQVFRPEHPIFDVLLAPEHRQELERLVEGLPPATFTAADALGWVYQFWQTREKNDVNRSEVKIGADELPAITQIFTEPYMVRFLLDNSLGAWWAARRLSDADLRNADDEAELRRKAAIPGVPLDYLRFLRSTAPKTPWRLAAGAFGDWPAHLTELKVLDPCCGSGHFLVTAFSMLVPMRMEQEGLAARDAVDAVLRDNLHGLELDARCVELAAFALALAAWKYPGAGGHRPLPNLHIACSGLAPNSTRQDWTAMAERAAAAGGMAPEHHLFSNKDTLLSVQLHRSLEALYEMFAEAPLLGSLIDPRTLKSDLFQGDYESVRTLFATALKHEPGTDEQTERAVAAQGMAEAAELLAGRYHLVVTNVPYLARGKHGARLKEFCAKRYPAAKNDVATVFLERCLESCTEDGVVSLVLPQNWLFLASYRKLREKLLKAETWHLLARLGPGAFETISGEVVKAVLLTLSHRNPTAEPAELLNDVATSGMMYCLDVSESHTTAEKAEGLTKLAVACVQQTQQLSNPDARITCDNIGGSSLLASRSQCLQGISPADTPRFSRCFWEFPTTSKKWDFWQSTVQETTHYGGRELLLQSGRELEETIALGGAYIRGTQAWDKKGIVLRQMSELPCSLYSGNKFDTNCAVILPEHDLDVPAIWCFCSSPEYHEAVRRIDQKLNVTNATLVKVPFDLDRWTKVASAQYPHGLPRPYSDDPTQWIFHGHPCGSVIWDDTGKHTAHGPLRTDPSVLQVGVARLLGYRWPAERDPDMELADEQREWVLRCDALAGHADADGIVCIPSVRHESSAAERLSALLDAAYGDAWSEATLTALLHNSGSPNLDDWLRNGFFRQHCAKFHHRPFVWHIWDGRRDGFHALVNYHKLTKSDGKGRQLLESLTYSYLGDWIARQQDAAHRGEPGAEDRLAAAQGLQQRLDAILKGEPPYDVFVRWKALEEQPIGWEPGIDDGVRLNIRPFMAKDIPGGSKGAGILRTKPNIHWRKDRGKEPVSLRDAERFPWFWRDGAFTGDRINEIHFTTFEKRAARHRVEGKR